MFKKLIGVFVGLLMMSVGGTASGAVVLDQFYENESGAGGVNTPVLAQTFTCLLYTSPSPRDATLSRMPSSA